MTGLRQLEARLRAWRGFHGIAGATRTLAAAQHRHWSEAAHRAEQHLQRCRRLRAAHPETLPRPEAPAVVLALGTDLGLCGPFNRIVAQALAETRRGPVARVMVVGRRLGTLVDDELPVFGAPSSWERVEGLAAQLDLLLRADVEHRLVIAMATAVDPDGRPLVETLDEHQQAIRDAIASEPAADRPRHRAVVDLVDPEQTGRTVAALTRHARLVAALARSAASEAEARWRTMNRAHDAAGRRIVEQERTLSRRRQEQVTQEMLEARQGRRLRGFGASRA